MTDRTPSAYDLREATRRINIAGRASIRTNTTRADNLCEAVLVLISRNTHTNQADGFPASTAGGIPPNTDIERLTPVEAAAETNLYGNHTDPVDHVTQLAANALIDAGRAIATLEGALRLASELQSAKPGPGRTVDMCSSVGTNDQPCGDIATRKGRCDACRQYLRRHPDTAEVPRHVIDDRHNQPKRRHETGPLA